MFAADNSTLWTVFTVLVFGALVLDLGVLNRKSHTMKVKEALFWCTLWFCLALLFCGGLYYQKGQESAVSFLAGYLIELSLSVDNLFVFIMLFEFFKVQPKYQHRILFWGILGAVVFRAIFIVMGLQLIHHFEWILYLLGVFLVFIGAKMTLKKKDGDGDSVDKSPIIRLLKKILPLTDNYDDQKFFTREKGKLVGTPLFLVLMAVEVTDVVFAMDSIPAVIAVTRDPFIVFTSNIFAILGLRSMYFLLAGVMGIFHYLHYGVGLILVYVGIKMLMSEFYKIPVYVTLTVMINVLFVSIILSLLMPPKDKKKT